MATKLKRLDNDLGESYEQVVEDLGQMNRRTYRGTAAELREVLRGVLDRLAPDREVKGADWYKQARQKGSRGDENPTMSEKTKYILRKRGLGLASMEAAESYMSSIEEKLGHVVRATYRRASNSTHSGVEREDFHNNFAMQMHYLQSFFPGKDRGLELITRRRI